MIMHESEIQYWNQLKNGDEVLLTIRFEYSFERSGYRQADLYIEKIIEAFESESGKPFPVELVNKGWEEEAAESVRAQL